MTCRRAALAKISFLVPLGLFGGWRGSAANRGVVFGRLRTMRMLKTAIV